MRKPLDVAVELEAVGVFRAATVASDGLAEEALQGDGGGSVFGHEVSS